MLSFISQYPLVLYEEKKLALVPVLKPGSPVFCVSMGGIRWEHHDICYHNSKDTCRNHRGDRKPGLLFLWQPAFKGRSQGSVRTTLIPPKGGMPPVTSESFTRPHNAAATWGPCFLQMILKGITLKCIQTKQMNWFQGEDRHFLCSLFLGNSWKWNHARYLRRKPLISYLDIVSWGKIYINKSLDFKNHLQ